MKLSEIARAIGCELRGDDVDIRGVAAIEDAEPGTLTFAADRRHARWLATTRAAAVVLATDAPEVALPSLRARNPYLAFVAAVELFHPPRRPEPGLHPTAVVAPSARLGAGASVGPHVVVAEDVVIGRDAVLHAGVVIYPRVRIGDGFTAHAGVVVREDVRIGDRVTLHAGAVIGSDGFGYVPQEGGHRKIPQVGTVVLEDDVALGATVVGRGTKIDNRVMVGHGSRIGPHCLLAAQVGLAGGTRLGTHVMLGGQAGLAGHLTVGDRARVAARSGVHGDVPAGATYGGYPATEVRRWNRAAVALLRLPGVLRRLRRVERALGLPGDAGE